MIHLLLAGPIILPLLALMVIQVMPANAKNGLYSLHNFLTTGFLFVALGLLIHQTNSLHPSLTLLKSANFAPPFGITLIFDHLSVLMLFIFALIGSVISLYSLSDRSTIIYFKGFFTGYWLLIMGVAGAILTADIFNLYVWFEVILVGAFVILSCSTNAFKQGLTHYVILNIIGTLLLLTAVGLIYGLVGSLNYANITTYLHQAGHDYIILPIMMLFLIALSVKGALFPLYFWLPKSYPAPCISATALISSLITKTTMVILLRFVTLFTPLQQPFFVAIIVIIGIITMILGVLGAATQFNIRKILSFHIISQLGYIVIAIAIQSTLAIMAAVYFLIHNIFVKTNLFLISGHIENIYQTDGLKKLGGIIKNQTFLAVMFFLAAFSLAGFPPLSGFWAKFLVIKAAIEAHFYWSALFAILVGLMTLYSMTKIWHYAFCQSREITDDTPLPSGDFSPLMQKVSLSAIILINLMMLVISLTPDILLQYLHQTAIQLMDTSTYITSMTTT